MWVNFIFLMVGTYPYVKSTVHLLKLAAIFNLVTKVSFFSIDSPKFQFLSIQALLIFFSQNALNSDSQDLVRFPRKLASFFFFFFFFQIPASLNLSEKIFLAGSMASEKRVRRISPDSSEFAGFRPLFQISPDSDMISPKLLLSHFGEKKNHC
jgi:hypothetical protein